MKFHSFTTKSNIKIETIINIVTYNHPIEYKPVVSNKNPKIGGNKIAPHELMVILAPVATPAFVGGANSEVAFIHTPWNPEVPKPKINAITAKR